MPNDFLSEDCGRIFEVGFNCGLLTFIAQQKQAKQMTEQFGTLYQEDLERLRFQPMAANAIARAKNVGTAPKLRRIAEQLLLHFCFKGFLLGLHFLEEYLLAQGLSADQQQVHIRYLQCSFRDSNSLGMIPPDPAEDDLALRRCLSQLDPEIGSASFNFTPHKEKGRFLKADCLLLLQWGGEEVPTITHKKAQTKSASPKRGGFLLQSSLAQPLHSLHTARHWRILCLDLSAHSLTYGRLRDPNNITVVRQILQSELGYLRTRGIFSNLSYDVAEGMPESTFATGLEQYLTAFKKKDKESAKLIQAGGYAYDFFELMTNKGMIQEQDDVICHAFGVSDRDINSMHVRREHMTILHTCQQIYQNESKDETIESARDAVIQTIQTTASRSFEGNAHVFEQLQSIDSHSDGCFWLSTLTETIPVLSSKDLLPIESTEVQILDLLGGPTKTATLTIQQAHTELEMQALASSDPYLFLTANPGIGKTTALVEYLIECEKNKEGFLLFYLSPRTQVNIDLIDKFRTKEDGPLHGSILALTTNSTLLEGRKEPTVVYTSAQLQGKQTRPGVKTSVTFLQEGSPEAQTKDHQNYRIASLLEDQIWDHGGRTIGVLYSICQAISANMTNALSDAVVATVSIQSLKKKEGAQDTLNHLEHIFACARAPKSGKILPERLQELAKRVPHLIFMIDEITGDESGVAFLSGLHTFADRHGLFSPDSPFHTKIVIADASVVNRKVIERHLRSTDYEPEKIYFQHIPDPSRIAPISMEKFSFKHLPAQAINTNTYPARTLHLSYHLCVECQLYQENSTQLPESELQQTLQTRLFEDLFNLIRQPKQEVPQILVYIQNKRRLTDLIALLQDRLGSFVREKDFLEIHASISEAARKNAQKKRKEVRVVFMTASASRGLSFPEATHFLIDVPRFHIEANTMEILQVIYRGRGGMRDLQDKYLQFYLSDRVIYTDPNDRARSLRERVLGLLDMLVILKTSMMTRIMGAWRVGYRHFQMIPVGGKAVSSAGATFPDTMAEFIRNIQNEARQHPERWELQKVATYFQQLFGEGHFHWEPQQIGDEQKPSRVAYLPSRTRFMQRFQDLISQRFDMLMKWPHVELVYHTGGIVVIPSAQKKLNQHYLFDLRERLRSEQGQKTLQLLYQIENAGNLPDHIAVGIRKAKELLTLLQEVSDEKTQQFLQSSRYLDQYYALPLLAFLVPEVFQDYFATALDYLEPMPFRRLLAHIVRANYPTDTMLPIGEDYRTYPFIVFRSFNLKEVRHRLFSGNAIFSSYELNVLNMLLSTQPANDEA